jgi:hypothetical protein
MPKYFTGKTGDAHAAAMENPNRKEFFVFETPVGFLVTPVDPKIPQQLRFLLVDMSCIAYVTMVADSADEALEYAEKAIDQHAKWQEAS